MADEKVYPGSLSRYQTLRALREETEESLPMNERVALVIAEELAGLAYILDGIRYSARKQS